MWCMGDDWWCKYQGYSLSVTICAMNMLAEKETGLTPLQSPTLHDAGLRAYQHFLCGLPERTTGVITY